MKTRKCRLGLIYARVSYRLLVPPLIIPKLLRSTKGNECLSCRLSEIITADYVRISPAGINRDAIRFQGLDWVARRPAGTDGLDHMQNQMTLPDVISKQFLLEGMAKTRARS